MYRCEECGELFEEPIRWTEYHGEPNLPGEEWVESPCCEAGFDEASYIDEYDDEDEDEEDEEDDVEVLLNRIGQL